MTAEKERSDVLLANILPKPIIEQLKNNGTVTPVHYESVSVLFADFAGFTKLSEGLEPSEIVGRLGSAFALFDTSIEEHGLEKLRTMGDGYMCAGGLPQANDTHAVDCVLAALQIQAKLVKLRRQSTVDAHAAWRLRIGINSGPVVAGVIEGAKFAYDIWGRTVNVASRMESSGSIDRVNISAATYSLIAPLFVTAPRGRIHAKNVGDIEMYFVNRIRPEFSADAEGLEPNAAFGEALGALTPI